MNFFKNQAENISNSRTYATGTVRLHLDGIYVPYKNGASKEDS
jgi:hypothetical protein